MVVVVYSGKGGVGKTSISYSLSKDLNLRYMTNDVTESALRSKSRVYSKSIPLYDNALYDFGGFESSEAYKIAESADIVIVPTICEMNSLFKALLTIRKIKNKKIIVINTMIDKQKDIEQVRMVIGKHFEDIEVLPFRRNQLLKRSMEEGISAYELMKNDKKSFLYKNAFAEYLNILKKVKSFDRNCYKN